MSKQVINTEKAPAPIGPYSQAIMAGDTLYVSVQNPINPATGELVQGSLKEETEQVMQNLKAVIEAAGLQLTDVVKCGIFLSDMDHFGIVNEVYCSYFNNDTAPARETVAVKTLPKQVNVEISAVVYKG